jgi:hypothetical protein
MGLTEKEEQNADFGIPAFLAPRRMKVRLRFAKLNFSLNVEKKYKKRPVSKIRG